MFTVEDETGGLECFVHAIKRAVLVGGAGELLGQLDAWIWLGCGARVACCPELLNLGFQYENPACRHVRDGLSSCSFGFRTGKLKFQVSFLHSGAVQAVAQGSDVSNVGGRGRGQSIQAACEAGDLGMGLPQKVEQDRGDLQRLITCALTGLIGLAHSVELLQRIERSLLGQEHLAGGHRRFTVESKHGGVCLRGIPQGPSGG
ncbi:hypothetical protein EAO76_29745 [Streptomyces sp. sk2.1]|nr:hypothetical protein EAO76_29745 [Streptomyces sp. sk2.1]